MPAKLGAGDKVSCPAWVFDAPGAGLRAQWSYQTFGGKWRKARCGGVVTGWGAGGEDWRVRWDSDGSESEVPRKHLRVEKRAPKPQAKP